MAHEGGGTEAKEIEVSSEVAPERVMTSYLGMRALRGIRLRWRDAEPVARRLICDFTSRVAEMEVSATCTRKASTFQRKSSIYFP